MYTENMSLRVCCLLRAGYNIYFWLVRAAVSRAVLRAAHTAALTNCEDAFKNKKVKINFKVYLISL